MTKDLEMNAHVAHDTNIVEPAKQGHRADRRRSKAEARANKLRLMRFSGLVLSLSAVVAISVAEVNDSSTPVFAENVPTQTEPTPSETQLLKDMDRADNPHGKDANSRHILPEDDEIHVR